MSRSKVSTDHDEIRRWAEARGGQPSAVKGTSRRKEDVGMIRIDFPGYSGGGKLEPISWDEWFEKFDQSGLAMILQEETAKGEQSNFNKLVSRIAIEGDAKGGGSRGATGGGSGGKSRAARAGKAKSKSRGARAGGVKRSSSAAKGRARKTAGAKRTRSRTK